MIFGIGNDHVAVDLKNEIVKHLESQGITVKNYGTDTVASCDYPDVAIRLGQAINDNEVDYGILICGTGVGMSISANKIKGIRAAVCSEPYSAKMARAHNNANVLCFGSRVIGPELAKMIVDAFVNNEFEGKRHQRRVDKINAIEKD